MPARGPPAVRRKSGSRFGWTGADRRALRLGETPAADPTRGFDGFGPGKRQIKIGAD